MPAVVPIHRLKGRVLGLIGFGNIPRSVAPKAKAFGLEVIAFDPYASDAVFSDQKVERVSLEALLERSDFVSVHAPATPETAGLLNADTFRAMKNTALVVNTARGPLINERDLVAALDAGEIGGAALDVVESEPLAPDSPLLGRDNVILSPHTAFYSVESLDELQAKAASDAARVLAGEAPVYPISAG
jgi:D-3-phosphoglycerate dehydrogenase